MITLGEFLKESAARRREAGIWDCCTFPAAWAIACGYADPMAAWRGQYSSEAEALTIIAETGGLCELFARGMASAGIGEIGEMIVGDIAVVRLMGEDAGAIFTGKRWALVADRGMAFASLDRESVIRIWRVNNG